MIEWLCVVQYQFLNEYHDHDQELVTRIAQFQSGDHLSKTKQQEWKKKRKITVDRKFSLYEKMAIHLCNF